MALPDPKIDDLMGLSPFDFEKLVTQLMVTLGFRAQQTRLSRDGEVDIWAEDEKPFGVGRIIVQCKRYRSDNPVGEPVVRELFGLVHAHGVNKGILLTTSDFTADAHRFAAGKPIELISGTTLLSIIRSAGQSGLHLSSQAAVPALDTFSDTAATMAEVLN